MEEELKISEIELEELVNAAGGAQQFYIDYVVKKGDNLTRIAKKHGTTWKRIYALNRDIISNPNHIEPGWVLTVPTKS